MNIFSIVSVLALLVGVSAMALGAASEDSTSQAWIPKGVIVMWSGSIEDIPDGWSLCDGTKGTPDLRDRFVLGTGTTPHVGVKGGSYSHLHRQADHAHRITFPRSRVDKVRIPYGYRGDFGTFRFKTHQRHYYANARVAKSSSAATPIQAAQNLPPYFKIAFIIKN